MRREIATLCQRLAEQMPVSFASCLFLPLFLISRGHLGGVWQNYCLVVESVIGVFFWGGFPFQVLRRTGESKQAGNHLLSESHTSRFARPHDTGGDEEWSACRDRHVQIAVIWHIF